MSSRQGLRNYT